jgi:NAD(P)-dependent dehydrogenase (short-subunit alcohol dehydrogenase family)
MKILVIGANGAVGSAVANELATRHEVISAGSRSGDYIADIAQVRALFAQVGKLDAVVVAAGNVHFGPLAELGPEQFQVGIASKLMGQVNVAQVAVDYLNDGGSITLVSGIVSEHPIRYGTSASMVNGAVEAFVRAAAQELPRGVRINVVSPNVLVESWDKFGPYFCGFEAVPAKRVALGFTRSVEGLQTGQVIRVW